jgi:hypothetical protein
MTWQEARTEEQNRALGDLITFLETVGPALEEGVGQHEQDHFILPAGLADLDREKTQVGTQFDVDDENLCGTTGCAAGWACVQAGYKFRWIMKEDHDGYKYLAMEIQDPGTGTWHREYDHDGEGTYWSFEDTAAGLLGLTPRQANDIFYTWDEPTAIQKLKNVLDGTWTNDEREAEYADGQ